MIKLIQTQPEGGDCTAPYDVVFNEPYTVGEFIDEILKRGEWGIITISTHQGSRVRVKYSRKGLKDQLPVLIAEALVTKAQAGGGWSRMDYSITALEK